MRFSFQDIKKSVQRRKGELMLSLHFLRTGELRTETAQLIAYFEGLLGQPQRAFSVDEARTVIGDYRLAHCLIATLSYWYEWQHPDWKEVLSKLSYTPVQAERPLPDTPSHLRLELYSYVNENYHGFLDVTRREAALSAFAARYGLAVSDLEYLLVLDTDEEACLVRNATEPPSPQEVATRYNQWVFEAALANASQVHFSIDYNAFARITAESSTGRSITEQRDDESGTSGTSSITTGIGTTIKRLCYLARTIGVYYDLAYEPSLAGQQSVLSLVLYGPQDVTGVPQQYGVRLARLCRALLGYTSNAGSVEQRTGNSQKRKQALLSAIVEATATVYLSQRASTFHMTPDILRLLPANADLSTATTTASSPETNASLLFDSSIEQSFAEAFAASERSHAVDEWHLEREPEPLLLEQSIFIPDFALTRGQHRIYIEILGFWTPSYRERKVQKLQQLRGRNDILLAIPVEAKDAYASILSDFPVVLYDGQLSATDVLTVLRSTYNDFASRIEQIDRDAVQEMVRQQGLLSEQMCLELLHCYRRSELQQAVVRVCTPDVPDIIFTPGVGLYTRSWLTHVKEAFLGWLHTLPEAHPVSLTDALAHLKSLDVALQRADTAILEAVMEQWSELRIERDSIFNATLHLATMSSQRDSGISDDGMDANNTLGEASPTGEDESSVMKGSGAREGKRERRTTSHVGARKRLVKETQGTIQENLWG